MHAREGIFAVAFDLYQHGDVDARTRRMVKRYIDWYSDYLPKPHRFHRSKSKAEKYQTRGICWFKPDATNHIDNAQRLAAILERNGYPIETVKASRVGYIVYEDKYQVVADPFRDTPV